MRSSPDRPVRVRALVGDTVLRSWARHFTLTVPLSTQEYIIQFLGKPNKLRGATCDGLASRPGGVEILLAASCYRNRDQIQPDEPVLAPRLHFSFNLVDISNTQGSVWPHFQTRRGSSEKKYSAAPPIVNSLLCVRNCGQHGLSC